MLTTDDDGVWDPPQASNQQAGTATRPCTVHFFVGGVKHTVTERDRERENARYAGSKEGKARRGGYSDSGCDDRVQSLLLLIPPCVFLVLLLIIIFY